MAIKINVDREFVTDYTKLLSSDFQITKDNDCDGLIAGSNIYDAEVLSHYKNLKLICKVGSGVDNIDIAYCINNGIKIINSPKSIANSVAEFTLGQIIYGLRNVNWAQRYGERYFGKELKECIFGIFGMGNIGSALYTILNRLKCTVLYSDLDMRGFTKEQLFQECDVLSFHIPLVDINGKYHNIDFITSKELNQMKKDVIIINTSRDLIFKKEDLMNHLIHNEHTTYITDVEDELGHGLNNVIYTPHIAAYTYSARLEMETEAINNLVRYFHHE